MDLNSRCRQIICDLMKTEVPVTVWELSFKYKVSKRTIYNDLKDIEKWLAERNIQISSRPNAGIILNHDADLSAIKRDLSCIEPYFTPLSHEDRVKKTIAYIFINHDHVKIADVCNEVGMSKSTFYKDLSDIKLWFERYDLEVAAIQKKGIFINGSEMNMREARANFLMENLDEYQILSLIRGDKEKTSIIKNEKDAITINFFNEYFKGIDLCNIAEIMDMAQDLMGLKFDDKAYIALMLHTAIAVKRINDNDCISADDIKLKNLKNSIEFNIARIIASRLEKHFNISVSKPEIGYIALHLMSSRARHIESTEDADQSMDKVEEGMLDFITDAIEKFESLLNVNLQNDMELQHGLLSHLVGMYKRYSLGVQQANPLKDEIMKQFPLIFSIAKNIFTGFGQRFHIEIDEDEIGYITMYFAAAVERANNKKIKRVYAVCPTGVGGAQLLMANLKSKFPNIRVIKCMSMIDAETIDNAKADAIISTVELNNKNIPVIVVSPFILEKDMEKITDVLSVRSEHQSYDFSLGKIYGQDISGFISMISDAAIFIEKVVRVLGISISNETYMGLVIHILLQICRGEHSSIPLSMNAYKEDHVSYEIRKAFKDLEAKYKFKVSDYDVFAVRSYLIGKESNADE